MSKIEMTFLIVGESERGVKTPDLPPCGLGSCSDDCTITNDPFLIYWLEC